MVLQILAIRLLELTFTVGMIGSAIVVLMSFVQDAREMRGDD